MKADQAAVIEKAMASKDRCTGRETKKHQPQRTRRFTKVNLDKVPSWFGISAGVLVLFLIFVALYSELNQAVDKIGIFQA